MTVTAPAWKQIEKFAAAMASETRTADGPGEKIQGAATVSLEVSEGVGLVLPDSTVAGRVSWQALAVMLASKVNADTLAAVVSDFNAGKRPKPESLPAATRAALDGLQVKPSKRRGAVKAKHGIAVSLSTPAALERVG